MNTTLRTMMLTATLIIATEIYADSLAINGDFEETRVVQPTEWVHKTMRERGWKLDDPVLTPTGWIPNPVINDGEFRVVRSATEAHSGNHCVFLKGDLSNGNLPVSEGDKVTIIFWARAPRVTRVYGLLYSYGKDESGKGISMGDWLRFEATAVKEWQKFTGTLVIPHELNGYPVTNIVPVLRSNKGAFFDDVRVTIDKSRRKITGGPSQPTEGKMETNDAINGNFEGWVQLEKLPAGWELTQRRIPWRWAIEDRSGQNHVLRRVLNPTHEHNEFGVYSLCLTGHLVSTRTLTDLTNKDLQISLWARGTNGSILVRLRQYSTPTLERVDAVADVLRERTENDWKEYTSTVTMVGGMPLARLELVGDGVVVDRVRVTPLETGAAVHKQLPQMRMTIPVSQTPPKVDGRFAPEEWNAALGIRNGFMNIATRSATWRQTELYLASDGDNLFVATRVPIRPGGLKTTITQRDGNVWEDESVEVFINPNPGPRLPAIAYQFIVNACGAIFDQCDQASMGRTEPGWNCPGIQVANGSADGRWIMEMSIPLNAVGLKMNALWGLNVARNLCYPSEFSNLTGGPYRDYEHMILCAIEPGAPGLQWEYGGNLKEGKIHLTATLRSIAQTTRVCRVSLALLSDKTREETITVSLKPGEARTILLPASETAVRVADLRVFATDETGRALFDQTVHFDNNSFVSESTQSGRLKDVRVEFYPVQKKINVRWLNLASRPELKRGEAIGKTHIFIQQEGNTNGKLPASWQVSIDKPLIVGNTAHITTPFAPPVDGTYLVRAQLLDKEGNCLEFVSDKIEKCSLPWLRNSLGKDRIVIPPFTPMEVKGSAITCWGRSHRMDASGLPCEIRSAGQAVLASPIRLILEDRMGAHVASAGKQALEFTEKAKDRVAFRGASNLPRLAVKLDAVMEYDGMIRYHMHLIPQGAIQAKRLSLEIPVQNACYAHATGRMRELTNLWLMAQPPDGEYIDANAKVWTPAYSYAPADGPHALYLPKGEGVIWSSLGLTTPQVYGNFVPHVWLGNARYGIAWFSNNDRGWINDADTPCFELIRRGNTIALRVNFISKSALLSSPRSIIFGLMTTPVRPRVTGSDTAFKIASHGFDNTFLKECMGITYRDPFLAKQRVDNARSRGHTIHTYLANDLFPMKDPAMEYLRHEWGHEPFATYTDGLSALPKKLFGPNADDYIALLTCAMQSRIDYQVYCFHRGMQQGCMDGVYLDNSYPHPCVNLQHETCGYLREDGKLQAGYHLFETRDLIKRCATLSYLHKTTPPWFSVHSTSAMVAPCFSFADVCIDGEYQHDTKDFLDFFTLPYIEVFGAGAWGITQGWLPKLHGLESQVKPTRTLLAALKLFDMWIWRAYCNTVVLEEMAEIENHFGITAPDCRFIGYWDKEASTFSGLPAGVKVSHYLRFGKGALAYISNLTKEKRDILLTFNVKALGITTPVIIDAENDLPLVIKDSGAPLSIEGHDFRVLMITAR